MTASHGKPRPGAGYKFRPAKAAAMTKRLAEMKKAHEAGRDPFKEKMK